MQRRLIPLKRDHDTPLLGSSTCFDGSSRGGSDGPLLPSASRITPHKPSRSPALHGRYGRLVGVEGSRYGSRAARQASTADQGWKAVRYARQARVGRHDPETDFGMIPLPTPHHHQTGSATCSRGCHAIAQKGPAKAFCCVGGMMTADGGVGEAGVESGLHTRKCPVQGIASNRTIIHGQTVIGRMGRGENPRQGIFTWFWPIGNTLR